MVSGTVYGWKFSLCHSCHFIHWPNIPSLDFLWCGNGVGPPKALIHYKWLQAPPKLCPPICLALDLERTLHSRELLNKKQANHAWTWRALKGAHGHFCCTEGGWVGESETYLLYPSKDPQCLALKLLLALLLSHQSFITDQTGAHPQAVTSNSQQVQSADQLHPCAVWPIVSESRLSLLSISSRSAPGPSSRPSTYKWASDFRASKWPKYSAPTFFKNRGNRRSRHQGQPPKIVSYDWDVILLPKELKG